MLMLRRMFDSGKSSKLLIVPGINAGFVASLEETQLDWIIDTLFDQIFLSNINRCRRKLPPAVLVRSLHPFWQPDLLPARPVMGDVSASSDGRMPSPIPLVAPQAAAVLSHAPRPGILVIVDINLIITWTSQGCLVFSMTTLG